MKKNKKMSGGKKMALAGVAAIGAGAYYFLGPQAKAHQKKASVLMSKVKKEVNQEVNVAKKFKNEWKQADKIIKKSVKIIKNKKGGKSR